MDIQEIRIGFQNYFKKLAGLGNPQIEQIAMQRVDQCLRCSLFDGVRCNSKRKAKHIHTNVLTNGCGCIIKAKARNPQSKCPLGKW